MITIKMSFREIDELFSRGEVVIEDGSIAIFCTDHDDYLLESRWKKKGDWEEKAKAGEPPFESFEVIGAEEPDGELCTECGGQRYTIERCEACEGTGVKK